MKRRIQYPEVPDEQRIRELESELYDLRRSLVQLAPKVKNIKGLDHGWFNCKSTDELYTWLHTTVQAVVEASAAYTKARHRVPKERMDEYEVYKVFCPLCGAGTTSGYGFVFPGGLELHLYGERIRRCKVMEAAWNLAEDRYNREYREAEEKAEKEKLEERRRKEPLFKIRLDKEPVLNDEGRWEPETRDQKKLAFAEERLQALGFSVRKKGHVRTYSYEDERCLVLADPRSPVRITFRVYSKPQMQMEREFSLPDQHKNNLPEKFQTMLSEVLGR